jgi:opacity protein-like surface antigen
VFYFRIDAAYSFSDSDRFRTDYDVYAPNAREDDGLSQFGRYGIGVGAYFTHWLRGDVTIDVRNEVVGEASTMVSYTDPVMGLAMRDVIADRIRYRNGTLLFNAYADIPVTSRFTPYVGAGVGVVLHSYSRDLAQLINCVDTLNDCNPATPLFDPPMTHHFLTGSDKDYAFAFAAALMAGVTTQIWSNTKLDIGYRFLHLDGHEFTHRVFDEVGIPNLITTRHVTIPDQNIHELRIGLRIDISP